MYTIQPETQPLPRGIFNIEQPNKLVIFAMKGDEMCPKVFYREKNTNRDIDCAVHLIPMEHNFSCFIMDISLIQSGALARRH